MRLVKYVHRIHIVMVNQDFIVHKTKYLHLEANTIQIVGADQDIMVQMVRDVLCVYSIIFVKVVRLQLHALSIMNHQLEVTPHQIVCAHWVYMFWGMVVVNIVFQAG